MSHWIKPYESLTVHGHVLDAGMIYTGKKMPALNYAFEDDASLINPELPVFAGQTSSVMGYWPYYAKIPPQHRSRYLTWLSTGRNDPTIEMGYVFLFFYGLERRLLCDDILPDEVSSILEEIARLIHIYGHSRSFRKYAHDLISCTWSVHLSHQPIPSYIDPLIKEQHQVLRSLLALYAQSEDPVPAHVAYAWIHNHHETKLNTTARRASGELYHLFCSRYVPITVEKTRNRVILQYLPASPSLQRIYNLPLSVAEAKPDQLPGLRKLFEQCVDDLEPYSRYKSRKNDMDPLAAMSLLPDELIHLADPVKALKAELSHMNGIQLVPAEALIASLGSHNPINQATLQALSNILGSIGLAFAPDPALHRIQSSDMIALFASKEHIPTSSEFHTTALIVRFGALLSHFDPSIQKAEETIMHRLIMENSALSDPQKQSLQALLHWVLYTPQKFQNAKKHFAHLSHIQKEHVAKMLVSLVHAHGHITPENIVLLEKMYQALGISREHVLSDIQSMFTAKDPVLVKQKDEEILFTLKPQKKEEFSLDTELIRLREEQTAKVQTVLEEIFQEEEVVSPIEEAADNTKVIDLLDTKHQALFAFLMEQESWPYDLVEQKCQELGLMADGAMETLNDWAFDNANAALIDQDDLVYIERDIGEELKHG